MTLWPIKEGAEFSACRKYRYALWRIWDASKGIAMFIGLNPSTANEMTDDPTIKSCKRLVKNAGYGGFYMCNLYGYVTSDPEVLKKAEDPMGDNDQWLQVISRKCDVIVFVWGAFNIDPARIKKVNDMFSAPKCLGTTKAGHPKHPLYIKSTTHFIPFV